MSANIVIVLPTVADHTITCHKGEQIELSRETLLRSSKGEVKIFMNVEDMASALSLKEMKQIISDRGLECDIMKKKFDQALRLWDALLDQAREVTLSSQRKKPGKLANRKYVLVDNLNESQEEFRDIHTANLTPQAQACLRLFLSEGTNEVSEARMKELVEERQADLNTRQDPWRIWQYYRPQLIELRWIRLV